MDYAALISEIEADIRRGQAAQAAKRLNAIDTAKVPRKQRLPLANLCRRTGLYSRGLTLLYRVINPSRGVSDATPQELAEYSVLLLRSGALDEAQETLRSIDISAAPEALLYQAFCSFTCWDGEGAVGPLERYLKLTHAPYTRLVGLANLAHAYIDGPKPERALPILAEVIHATDHQQYANLRNTCLAMRAQVHIDTHEFAAARADLLQARREMGTTQSYDQQRISKWSLILDALESRTPDPLKDLRAQARAASDWETLREADLYELTFHFREEKFLHLLFGTPFAGFRARVERTVGRVNSRQTYVLGQKSHPRLDMALADLEGQSFVRAGSKAHQLLVGLTTDFYRPLSLGQVFSALFPTEHFNIFSSPNRVHQLISRTRRWLIDSGHPLTLSENAGFYSLEVTGEISLRLDLNRRPKDALETQFSALALAFRDSREFSAAHAAMKLGLSRAEMKKLLSWAVSDGRLERLGSSARDATYRLPSALHFSAA